MTGLLYFSTLSVSQTIKHKTLRSLLNEKFKGTDSGPISGGTEETREK
jgi:hypothetical protein